jgi:hypothetical protein
MVVTCAFYGFINRATKVTLQVDREQLEVGRSFVFEGDQYIVLSVFEADDHYCVNVGLEHLQRSRTPVRPKTLVPPTCVAAPKEATEAGKQGQEAVVEARLQAAEAQLQDLLRERDEALKLLDHAIQELDHLQQKAGQ